MNPVTWGAYPRGAYDFCELEQAIRDPRYGPVEMAAGSELVLEEGDLIDMGGEVDNTPTGGMSGFFLSGWCDAPRETRNNTLAPGPEPEPGPSWMCCEYSRGKAGNDFMDMDMDDNRMSDEFRLTPEPDSEGLEGFSPERENVLTNSMEQACDQFFLSAEIESPRNQDQPWYQNQRPVKRNRSPNTSPGLTPREAPTGSKNNNNNNSHNSGSLSLDQPHTYHRAKAHKGRGVETQYRCGYCLSLIHI
eukprot:TRINITY_DN17243_c0_g3_i1.p1 TRINITY_DN17243_c0_g3~~TRINITY_DN17243_c0_g3_i1.p1  ORF type:complete len:247 (-),score=29.67 TRINITY_DN17243_c0_g3_i1:167-907(-)